MFFASYARYLLRFPKLSLLLALLVMLLFAYAGKDVRLNNHFSVLFAIDNQANEYRAFYREVFGADDGVLVAVLRPGIVDANFVEHLSQLTDKLSLMPNMLRVLSATNSSVIYQQGDELNVDALFGIESDLSLDEKLHLLRESPITANRFISNEHDSFIIMAELPSSFDRFERIKQPAIDFQQTVELAFADMPQPVVIDYAGIAFTRIGILKLMLGDLLMLVPLTSMVIALFTFLLFGSLTLIFISLATTLFGLAGTIGLMGLNGEDINQLTITFPVLLMVIVVANGIHFFHRYFREIEIGKTVEEAVRITSEKVAKAAFLSCLTTAIGFFALLTADMQILRSFGFYLGSGVLLSYVGLILIIPPALLLCKPSSSKVYDFKHFSFVDSMTQRILRGAWRWIIIAIGMVLLLLAVFLARNASYDYKLSDMLDENHPQVLAGNLLDQQFAGALPLEISLLGKANDFKQVENLRRVDALQQWLIAENIDASALSVAQIIKSLNHAFSDEYRIPDTSAAVAQLLLLAEGSSDNILAQLVTDDYAHARIKANIADVGAHEIVALKQRFTIFNTKNFAGTGIQAELTGELPVAYEGMNKLTEELLQSVLMALLFIVLTIFLVFRDWGLALGSIFPNVLPIMLGLAFYALSGQGLNPLPGIAFCIAIGIAVDDTVHLFARFNEEWQSGKPRALAIVCAVHEVKGALISSSIILTVGFLIFLFSGFTWNRQLGLLGAFLIVAALLADLIFTPAVLSIGRNKYKLPMQRGKA